MFSFTEEQKLLIQSITALAKEHLAPILRLGVQFFFNVFLPVSVNIPPIICAFGCILIPKLDVSKSALVIATVHKLSLPQNG